MRKVTLRFLLAGTGILLASATFAQVAVTPATTTTTLNKAISLCNVIENNIDKRLANFTDKKTLYVAKYELARTRTEALVTKLENAGYDVSQVKIDLVTFNDRIKKFGDDYTVYISDLQDTKTYTCGHSEGEFRAKLAIARTQLKVVHDDAVFVKTYWTQTVKPELTAFKTAVPSSSTVGGNN